MATPTSPSSPTKGVLFNTPPEVSCNCRHVTVAYFSDILPSDKVRVNCIDYIVVVHVLRLSAVLFLCGHCRIISLFGNTVGCAFIVTLTPSPIVIRLFSTGYGPSPHLYIRNTTYRIMAQQPTNDVRLSIVRLSGPENWSTFRYGCTLLMERARVLPVVLRQEPRPTEVTLLSVFFVETQREWWHVQ